MSSSPKTGTLQYPARELVALARLILYQYECHIKVEDDACTEADLETDAGLILDDIHNLNYFVNLPRFVEMEELGTGEKMDPADYCDMRDPRQPERALINVGCDKAEYLFADAVKFRKDTRGQPSNGEKNWDREDVLLDFIVFLSQPEHNNLFAVGT